MGPEMLKQASLSLPTRPKFSWDIKNSPWTDGVGSQECYAHSVKQWCLFHDRLPDNNANRIAPNVRGIILEANLYGRAKDLCKSITAEQLGSDTGATHVMNCIYKRDSLSVMSEIFSDFSLLNKTRRHGSETFQEYEARFSAQLAKYNSHSSTTAISDAIAGMMLLVNSDVDDSQRISILSAASPSTALPDAATTDQHLENVKYETIASVLRQCDTVKNMSQNLNSHSSFVNNRNPRNNKFTRRQNRRNYSRQNSSSQSLASIKARSKCRRCHKFGHWSTDHADDGSLKPGVKSYDSPPANNKYRNSPKSVNKSEPSLSGKIDSSNDNTIHFGEAHCVNLTNIPHDVNLCSNDSDLMQHTETSMNVIDMTDKKEDQQIVFDHDPNHSITDINMCLNNCDDEPNSVATNDPKNDLCLDHPMITHPEIDEFMIPLDELHPLPIFDNEMSIDDLMNIQSFTSLSESDYNKMLSAGMVVSQYTNKGSPRNLGPMVDDGAPYSALGVVELKMICPNVSKFDPIPRPISGFRYWQFGSGCHSSPAKRILGSTILNFKSDNDRIVAVRHIIVDGSSPWVIGRNVTRECNIIHISGHFLRLPKLNNQIDRITMIDHDHHSYIPLESVMLPNDGSDNTCKLAGFSARARGINNIDQMEWPVLKRILDKVHVHVCGHASFSDIKTLLQRNNLWNHATEHYVTETVKQCPHCLKSVCPKPSRKVSLSLLDKTFNYRIYIDHFYLDDVRLLHIMDGSTRYSACQITRSTSMDDSIIAFQSAWLNHHWPPTSIQADQAFSSQTFKDFVAKLGSELRIIPPRRHSKNVLEPKHGTIRSIFTRLKSSNPDADKQLLALQSVRVSNDMYGNDVISSFELCRGFSKPVLPMSSPVEIPDDIRNAHDELIAKRKLNLILRSKSSTKPELSVGDNVQIYVKNQPHKRGRWLSHRPVLSIDLDAETVTVPGSHGHTIKAAFEDTRIVNIDDDLVKSIIESIDEIDDRIESSIISTENDTNGQLHYNISSSGESAKNVNRNFIQDSIVKRTESRDFANTNHADTDYSPQPNTGDSIEVYWPEDEQYYRGTVHEITPDNEHVIHYDDGDIETLNMESESWRPTSTDDPVLNGSSVQALEQLKSSEQETLRAMHKYFGNKPFLKYESQGFCQAPVINSYKKEEESFLKTVKQVCKNTVPTDANIINSHTLYKIKMDENSRLKLKARIAPHGNEDSLKTVLRSDCCMCSPVGIRVILMIAAMKKWKVSNADVTSAFLQTGKAARKVYVVPPRESGHKDKLWLLLTAAYGLVNSNAKWQIMSDQVLVDFGLVQCPYIPQLFYKIQDRKLVLLVGKIVDDLLMTGVQEQVSVFIKHFNSKFKFGSVTSGPGKLRFYGLDITQHDDYTSSIKGDEKLTALESVPLTRSRRREINEQMNEIEKSSFMSVNSSLNWLGITASPLCSFYASFLQQRLPLNTVANLTLQSAVLRKLKRFGTTITYTNPPRNKHYNVSVVVFADAGRIEESAQISTLSGVLIGPLEKGSVYYTLNWSSHKSRRPVRSIGAAEIIAVGEAIDDGKTLKSALTALLGISVQLVVVTDSKDMYTSLSTQRNSVDKSIRSDVNLIRFEFETNSVNTVIWIPGKTNPADCATKRDSPLTDMLRLMLLTGKLPMSFESFEATSSSRSLG